MSRPPRGFLPLLVAGLLSACAAREPVRPAASPESSSGRGQLGTVGSVAEPQPALAASRFSLFRSKLSVPPLPVPAGSTSVKSTGIEGSESMASAPPTAADSRYAEYLAELKRRIEDKWVYPTQAARKGQSGKGEVRFVLGRDGSVRTVETVKSSGVELLDRHIEQAIRQAAPFPPIPASVEGDVPPISINFSYVLGSQGLGAP